MYGLFHRTIREMVNARVGAQSWQRVEDKLSLDASHFISARVYDDALTIDILAESAKVLELSFDDLLEQFGVFWIHSTSSGQYKGIMEFTGRTLPEFLTNMDRMHTSVRVAMPNAVTPLFSVISSDESNVIVQYQSERSGLNPLVVGLLKGLLTYFHLTGSVDQIENFDGSPVFRVTFEKSLSDD